MTPHPIAWAVTRGDTWRIPLNLTDDAGQPVDITDWDLASHIRITPDGDLIVEFEFEPVNLEAGQVDMVAPETVTQEVTPRTYQIDIEKVVEGERTTFASGTLTVRPDVTRNP